VFTLASLLNEIGNSGLSYSSESCLQRSNVFMPISHLLHAACRDRIQGLEEDRLLHFPVSDHAKKLMCKIVPLQ